MKKIIRIWLFLICSCLCACKDLRTNTALMQELTPKDMKELTTPIAPSEKVLTPPSAETASELPAAFSQPVSVSISETIPVKTILIELARQANVDLQLDPSINEKIILTAKNRPFIEVIEQICSLARLRYRIVHKTSLKIETDTPYAENYTVQFLNLSRQSKNSISVSTDVFASTPTQKTTGDNGSDTAVSVASSNDFWAELESNLKIILQTSAQPSATAPTYSLHKQAGIVTIFGTSAHHKQVETYLETVRRAATTQVLIEAKIVEVVLKDEFRSGINWQKVGSRSDWQLNAPLGDISKQSPFLSPTAAQSSMISLGAKGANFSSILQAIQEFGASRTLSSPRLTVMNNQSAILKVAQNQVYFRLNYDKQFSTAAQRDSISVSSEIQTVPIGLVMSVQPSVDPKTGEIILFLRPTISKLSQSVRDPAVDIAFNASLSSGSTTQEQPSMIPVVEIREIDSVLRLKSEEIAVLGGLMEVRSYQDESKLPVLGEAPLIKDLFSAHTEGDNVVELVILLKATILESSAPSQADHRLLEHYVRDPRPL